MRPSVVAPSKSLAPILPTVGALGNYRDRDYQHLTGARAFDDKLGRSFRLRVYGEFARSWVSIVKRSPIRMWIRQAMPMVVGFKQKYTPKKAVNVGVNGGTISMVPIRQRWCLSSKGALSALRATELVARLWVAIQPGDPQSRRCSRCHQWTSRSLPCVGYSIPAR